MTGDVMNEQHAEVMDRCYGISYGFGYTKYLRSISVSMLAVPDSTLPLITMFIHTTKLGP
jgi:hypothetical protein